MSVTLQQRVKNDTFSNWALVLWTNFFHLRFGPITYVVAYRGKIDPTIRALVNPDSECLGEECCSSVGDETFWDVGDHLRHSVTDVL